MGNLHVMIVNHISQVVGRQLIRLEEDLVIYLAVVKFNTTMNKILELGNPLWNLKRAPPKPSREKRGDPSGHFGREMTQQSEEGHGP